MHKTGLKLWSINTDFYYDEAIRLYREGVFDYIELYVVPDSLDTLSKWRELIQNSSCFIEGVGNAHSPLALCNFSAFLPPLRGKVPEGRMRGKAEGRGGGLKKASHFYTRQALEYSKELRKNMTESEKKLWHCLRNKQIGNLKFRRQEAIGNYIVDFVCYEKKLVIELDGSGHLGDRQIKHDKKRDDFLSKCGFKILRIFNNDINENIEGVIDYILHNLGNNPSPLTPLPQGARGKGIPFIIHCPHFMHGFNLAKKEKKISNRKIFDEVQKFADELNAEYIVIHGGIDGNIEETALQLSSFNEPRALIENKPYVALKNRMGGEFCRGYNVDEIKLVMESAKCGFCLDFGHAVCAANSLNKEPYGYIEQFLQLNPNMYHLTDIEDIKSPYDSHPHLGKGELDIPRILNLIPDNRCVTFETVKNSKENLDDFIEDMNYIKSL